MIILIGYIHFNPSDLNEFYADIKSVAEKTRTENGCLFYSMAVEDASAGRMLLVEKWQDQKSLTEHLEKQKDVPFLSKWGARIKIDVQKYDGANERSFMD